MTQENETSLGNATSPGSTTSLVASGTAAPRPDALAQAELAAAMAQLAADRGVVVRLADLLGSGVAGAAGLAMRRVGRAPALAARMQGLSEAMLARAYDLAVLRLTPEPDAPGSRKIASGRGLRSRHQRLRLAVAVSGAVSGASGLVGFAPDAIFTTVTIMRAIAAEATRQGEDLRDPATRRACLEVFALGTPLNDRGGKASGSNESELSYFAARLFLQGRPLALLMGEISARYGLALSQKLAAQAIPVLGAAAGALLNTSFLVYYQGIAQAHFTIRRLERAYGSVALAELLPGRAA